VILEGALVVGSCLLFWTNVGSSYSDSSDDEDYDELLGTTVFFFRGIAT
jgi:hypothetical protein